MGERYTWQNTVLLFQRCSSFFKVVWATATFSTFKKKFIYLILERGKGKKKERERNMVWFLSTWEKRCACLLRTSYWGLGPQPRHVPWLGIKPLTLWLAGPNSTHWATPARATFSQDFENQWINFIKKKKKKKPCWDFDCDGVKSIDQFKENWHLNNIEPSNPYRWLYFSFSVTLISFSNVS